MTKVALFGKNPKYRFILEILAGRQGATLLLPHWGNSAGELATDKMEWERGMEMEKIFSVGFTGTDTEVVILTRSDDDSSV